MVLFFLLFTVFSLLVAFNQPLSRLTRAKEESSPSATQTRVFAWPLYGIKADGKTWSTVTVIVRNDKTNPLEGRLVTLSTSLGTVKEPTLSTNKQGMAIFQLTSSESGIAKVEATIDNSIKASQEVSVEFVGL